MDLDSNESEASSPGSAAHEPVRFLVCGMPRSGTTLLAELLSRLPGVVVGPETHFLGAVPRGWWSSGVPRPGLVAHIERLRRSDACQLDDDRLDAALARLERDETSPATPVDAMFWLLGPLDGSVAAVGEKTPRHLEDAERALEGCADLRVVVMVRDPRDVQGSLREVPWNAGDPVVNATRWRDYARLTRRLRGSFPDRVLVVRFEDLVSDVDEWLGTVQRFLLGRAGPAVLAGQPASFSPEAEPWKAKALLPPDPSAAFRWQRRPDPDDAPVAVAAGRQLAAFGYRPGEVRLAERARLTPTILLVRARRWWSRLGRP